MALNESSAKLDMQLDITCKKFEKVSFDSGATELQYTDEMSGNKSNSFMCFISFLFRGLQGLHQEVRMERQKVQLQETSIRTMWRYHKGKTLSLDQFTTIQTMRTSEEMLKKHQEE